MTMARAAGARKAAVKKRKKRTRARQGGHPPWGWLLLGLAIGLGMGLTLYLLRLPAPSDGTRSQAAPTVPDKKARKTPPPAVEAEKPRFDFYTLLPQIEVEITPDKLEEALRVLPRTKKGGTYILQCGSFRDYDDADELKARLALLGIEAQIQTVVIKNGESWHRVRVGPLKGLAAIKPVRRKLKRNNINFVLLKIGEE